MQRCVSLRRQNRCRLFVLTACFFACFAPPALARTWTSRDGKTIEADFVDVDDERVTLKLSSGKESKVKLELLCDDDQLFLRGVLAKRRAKGLSTAASDSPSSDTESDEASPSPAPKRATKSSAPTKMKWKVGDKDEAEEEDEAEATPVKIENRTWTDVNGRTVTGKFAKMQGNMVVILRGGRQVTSDYWKLSSSDQEYIRELLESRGQESLIPRFDPSKQIAGAGGAPGIANPGMMPGAFPQPGVNPGAFAGGGVGAFPGFPGGVPGPGAMTGGIPAPAPFTPPTATDAARDVAERMRGIEEQNRMAANTATTIPPTAYGMPPTNSAAMGSGPGTMPGYPTSTIPGYTPPGAMPPGGMVPPSIDTSMPPMPAMAMPPVATYTPPMGSMYGKECGSCNREVPSHLSAGDKCPHCGVYFSFDDTNGKTASSWGSGSGGFRTARAVKGIIVLVVLVISGICAGVTALVRLASGGQKQQTNRDQW